MTVGFFRSGKISFRDSLTNEGWHSGLPLAGDTPDFNNLLKSTSVYNSLRVKITWFTKEILGALIGCDSSQTCVEFVRDVLMG